MEQNGQGMPKLLEHIEWQGADIINTTFATVSGMAHAVNEYSIAVPQVTILINRHYRDWRNAQGLIPKERIGTTIDYLLWELLLNVAEHGNGWDRNRSICIAIYLGNAGLVISCRDEGDFFKQEEVKRKFQTRERIHARDKPGRGYGTKQIYSHADAIEVDRETGTIFLLMLYGEKEGGP